MFTTPLNQGVLVVQGRGGTVDSRSPSQHGHVLHVAAAAQSEAGIPGRGHEEHGRRHRGPGSFPTPTGCGLFTL